MTRPNYIFTSESVSEGHPDKLCDQISDAVLDAFLTEEPEARVACETFATANRGIIGGEVGLSDQTKLKEYMGEGGGLAHSSDRYVPRANGLFAKSANKKPKCNAMRLTRSFLRNLSEHPRNA